MADDFFKMLFGAGYGFRSGRYQVWDFSQGSAPFAGRAVNANAAPTGTLSLAATGGTVTAGRPAMFPGDPRSCVRLDGGYLTGLNNGGGGANNPQFDFRTDQRWAIAVAFRMDASIMGAWGINSWRLLAGKQDAATSKGLQCRMQRQPDTGGRYTFRFWADFFASGSSFLRNLGEDIVVPAGAESAVWVYACVHEPAVDAATGWNNLAPLTGLRQYLYGMEVGRILAGQGGVSGGPVTVTDAIAAPLVIGADASGGSRFVGDVGAVAVYNDVKEPLRRRHFWQLTTPAATLYPDVGETGRTSEWAIHFTDVSYDPGDLQGLYVACALHVLGIQKMLALVSCSFEDSAPGMLLAVLRDWGLDGAVPVLCWNGSKTGLPAGTAYGAINGTPYLDRAYGPADFEDSTDGLRRIVAAHDVATKGKITFTMWGHARDIVAWLDSSVGGVTGKSQFAAKAACLMVNAGAADGWDGGSGPQQAPVVASGDHWFRTLNGATVSQGTIPPEFGQPGREYNVQFDAAAYKRLAAIMNDEVAPLNGGAHVPCILHPVNVAVVLTERNVNEFDRNRSAWYCAKRLCKPGGALERALADYAANAFFGYDATVTELGRLAWEPWMLMHAAYGRGGITDRYGRIIGRSLNYQMVWGRLWVQDQASAVMTLESEVAGVNAKGVRGLDVVTSTAVEQGWNAVGHTAPFRTHLSRSGPWCVVGRDAISGFEQNGPVQSLIDTTIAKARQLQESSAPAAAQRKGRRSMTSRARESAAFVGTAVRAAAAGTPSPAYMESADVRAGAESLAAGSRFVDLPEVGAARPTHVAVGAGLSDSGSVPDSIAGASVHAVVPWVGGTHRLFKVADVTFAFASGAPGVQPPDQEEGLLAYLSDSAAATLTAEATAAGVTARAAGGEVVLSVPEEWRGVLVCSARSGAGVDTWVTRRRLWLDG